MKKIVSLFFVFIFFCSNALAMDQTIEKTRENFGIKKISYAFMREGTPTYASDDYTYLSGSVAKGFAAELVSILKSHKILSGDEEKYGYSIQRILKHENSLTPYLGSLAGFSFDKRCDILKILKDKPLSGSSFSYQNITFLVLEEIIEDATGKPYREVLKEYILNPLKLYSSGSGYNDFCTRWNMYPPSLNNGVVPEAFCRAVCIYESAAGIFLSSGDLMRWGGYIYSSGKINNYKQEGVKISDDTYYYNGWFIKGGIAYSSGNVIGGGAVCAFDMSNGNGISILASGNASPLVPLAFEYFKSEKHDIPAPKKIKYPLPKSPPLSDICGVYENSLYGTLTITTSPEGYTMSLGSLSSPLTQVYGNIYKLSGIDDEVFETLPGLEYIFFATNEYGETTSATLEAVFIEGSGIFLKK